MAASSPCPLLPSRHRRRSHGDGSRNSRGRRSNSALFAHHTEKFCFRFASPAPPSTLDGIKALIADTPAISSVWIADCLYLSAIQRLARQPPACVTFVPYFRRRSCRVSISVSDVRLSEANADADRRQKAGEGNRREEAGG
jgi:hypothetical protein